MSPQDAALESRQLKDMLHNTNTTLESLEHAHAQWWQRHAAPLSRRDAPTRPESAPDRPLRIGYFCGDFSDNELTRLFRSVLEAHDRSKVQVYCYNDGKQSDLISEHASFISPDRWTDLVNVNDVTAAEIIQGDAIDVAVELNLSWRGQSLVGHGAKHRAGYRELAELPPPFRPRLFLRQQRILAPIRADNPNSAAASITSRAPWHPSYRRRSCPT